MSSRFLLLTIMLLGASAVLYAQKDSVSYIMVTGQLVGNEEHEPVPFAHIINKTRMWGTISDTAGYFTMRMNIYDTLLISAIGYERENFILPSFLKGKDYFTRIILTDKNYPIDEVSVYILGSYQQFSEKVERLRIPETKEEKRITELREEANEVAIRNYTAPTGISFTLPSKQAASLRHLRKITLAEENDIILNEKYNREVVAGATGLTGQELDNFIMFCNLRLWFTYQTSAYEIIYQIKLWYQEYLMLLDTFEEK